MSFWVFVLLNRVSKQTIKNEHTSQSSLDKAFLGTKSLLKMHKFDTNWNLNCYIAIFLAYKILEEFCLNEKALNLFSFYFVKFKIAKNNSSNDYKIKNTRTLEVFQVKTNVSLLVSKKAFRDPLFKNICVFDESFETMRFL